MDRRMTEMAAQMGQHREEMQETPRLKSQNIIEPPPLRKLINRRKKK